MQTLPSPPTFYARLQFSDAASCEQWLEMVPLHDPMRAYEMLAGQVELLPRTALPPLVRVGVLDRLLPPIRDVQARLGGAYTGAPAPLSIVEFSVWNSVVELWQSLFAAYFESLEASRRDGSPLAAHAPLLALRCIECIEHSVREHHRAYRAVPTGLWRQLNVVLEIAERGGYAQRPTHDPVDPDHPARTVNQAWARPVLSQAANPYGLSPRQADFVKRWLDLWEPLLEVTLQRPAQAAAPVAVDIASDTGPVRVPVLEANARARYPDLARLEVEMRTLLGRLRQGSAPADLGLGQDCRQPGAERLLTLLHVQWFGQGTGQLSPGHAEGGERVHACVGLAAVCQTLASGGGSGGPGGTGYGPIETWRIAALEAPGYYQLARGPECDERVRHHQLVAIKRTGGRVFQVGVIQCLRLEHNGDLSIGLRLLPGLPQAVEIRRRSGTVTEVTTHRAVLLPDAPTGWVGGLLVEPGLYGANQSIELLPAGQRAAMTRLTERGSDFERVQIAPLPA